MDSTEERLKFYGLVDDRIKILHFPKLFYCWLHCRDKVHFSSSSRQSHDLNAQATREELTMLNGETRRGLNRAD